MRTSLLTSPAAAIAPLRQGLFWKDQAVTAIEAYTQAREIIAMAQGPFNPDEVAARLRLVSPAVARAVPAAAALCCCDLKDGTGRVVYVGAAQ